MQISLQALYDATSTKRQKMQKLNLTALTNIINMKNSYLTTFQDYLNFHQIADPQWKLY